MYYGVFGWVGGGWCICCCWMWCGWGWGCGGGILIIDICDIFLFSNFVSFLDVFLWEDLFWLL